MSSTDFYRTFEERHRGSRELVGKRLEVYLPFIEPLASLYPPAAAVDLGCGRGEWLELLGQHGFEAQGIDLDEHMLQACRERSLSALQGDAVAHLVSLPDESQCVVSGFHIAEHVAFNDLETLVSEARRVLKPGGLLILETPNPENLVVGANTFWLDPTHQRPIPPPLLAFLAEYVGYGRVKTLRLQEAAGLIGRMDVRLIDVLAGASPDYSIVAQKAAPAEITIRFDAAFESQHGVEMTALAERHDSKVSRELAALDARLAQAEARAAGMTDALARIANLQDRLVASTAEAVRAQSEIAGLELLLKQTEARVNESSAQAGERVDELQQLLEQAEYRASEATRHAERAAELEQRAMAVEARLNEEARHIQNSKQIAHDWWLQAQAFETERNALRASWSWRVTGPLRWSASLALPRSQPGIVVKDNGSLIGIAAGVAQRPLAEAMRVVLRNPDFASRINQRLLRYPALHRRLVSVAQRSAVIPDGEPMPAVANRPDVDHDPANLTPRAREIYNALKLAIEHRQKLEA